MARVSYRSGQSVDEMRKLLEDVVATDNRPEWRRWAAELLGLNPPMIQNEDINVDSLLPIPPPESTPVEELPLIAPPAPNAPVPVFDREDLLSQPPAIELLPAPAGS